MIVQIHKGFVKQCYPLIGNGCKGCAELLWTCLTKASGKSLIFDLGCLKLSLMQPVIVTTSADVYKCVPASSPVTTPQA